MKKNLFLWLLALVITMVTLTPQRASTQTNIDLDITLQGITILHYFTNLDVTIDSTTMSQLLSYRGTDVDQDTPSSDITLTAHSLSGSPDLATDINAPSDITAVNLTIRNAWAVRAIMPSGTNIVTTNIVPSVMNQTIQDAGTDIRIIASLVSTATPYNGPGASVRFLAPGLVNPQLGNLVFTLDLTAATQTGTYEDLVVTLAASTL